jgi:ATP-dependent helicase/nuclease subunit B
VAQSLNLRRHFLAWDRLLLPQAVAWLARDWDENSPLDLSGDLVIVPTRQSGRRLREMLAEHATRQGRAVFSPRVMTPEALLTREPAADVASDLETLLAWTELFQALDLEKFREVFPVNPPAQSFSWAFRLARQFSALQALLAEGRLRIADVATKVGENFPEAARWQQLGELEQKQADILAGRGLRDASAARMAVIGQPPPTGIRRVVVIATPDPSLLAVAVLEEFARVLPVEVLIFAPPDESASFDEWGRPAEKTWEKRELVLPDFSARVHLCASPSDQAEQLAALAAGYAEPDGLVAIATADPEVLAPLESALARRGLTAFNPAGRPRKLDGFYQLLVALADFDREASYQVVEALVRCPDILAFLQSVIGRDFSASRLLTGLDELRERHLPVDLDAARVYAGRLRDSSETGRSLEILAELRTTLRAGDFSTGVAGILRKIFAGRRLDPVLIDEERLADSAAEWAELLRACVRAADLQPGLSRADWWELALHLLGEGVAVEEKPAGALELQGWLELPWEDAPHLALAGMNDGRVPEAVTADAFLPGSLREKLGLRNNASRMARDAYLLQALVFSRQAQGRVDLFFGKTSTAGDSLRPSRLLLRCADDLLPERVNFLFRDAELSRSAPAWTRAWKLEPGKLPPPAKVAVTALRDYLNCPFRFYLRRVLKMEAVDPAKNELDALDFGILCHAALEAMGRDPAARESTDAAALRNFLFHELERLMRDRYGTDLTVPLLIQYESARQRLGMVAEIQARERAAGWRIEAVEKNFTLTISGLVVAGKIDRIERNEHTGELRVLDFKTSDQAAQPRDIHFRSLREGENFPEWAGWKSASRPQVWADLQLPLYRQAIFLETGVFPACGYFNLPKAASETGLAMWDDITPELQEAAWICAEGISTAIRAGIFWPPRELHGREAEQDDFAALFQRGAGASVAWKEGAS